MKLVFASGLLALASAACSLAAVNGTVVNKTTGAPQAGVAVALVKPGQGGMRTLGTTTTDASGNFSFANDEPGGGPQLLQAKYDGVDYNKLLTPNIATSGVEVDVYESTTSPAVAHVAQRMLVVEPSISQISLGETVVIDNSGDRTYNNPKGGDWRFYLPPSANGQVRVSAQGPQGMPLPRAAEKTEKSNIFKIDFPIKPGETQFQISYVLPVGSPFTFRGEVVDVPGMAAGPLRLVAPPGVILSGKDIQQVGVEPNTQATIYNVLAKSAFSVDIAGTGSLNGGNDASGTQNEDESEPVKEGQPKIYTHLGWVLGMVFGVLGVGLVILFRNSPVRV